MDEIPVLKRSSSAQRTRTVTRKLGSSDAADPAPKHSRFRFAVLCFLSGAVGASLLLSTPAAVQMINKLSGPEKADDGSIDLLRKRLSKVGTVNRAQVKILAKELARIHRYEQRLRKRVAALDAVLDDALDLDYNKLEDTAAGAEQAKRSGGEELGVGGGREPSVPPIVLLPMERPIAAKRMGFVPRSNLIDLVEYQTEELARLPLGAPVSGQISSGFGVRRSPFSRRRRMHHGIDFAVDHRTVVRATADGVVVKAGYIGAYGRTVVIDHGNGYETLYGHMSSIGVQVGTTVCRGKRIGLAGSTGRSTGPHVHYEVRREGKQINPAPLVDLASFLRLI